MTELESQYRKWADLMDRRAAGEALSPEELAWCERLGHEHAACERELALFDELSELDVAPNADSHALVEATLARMAQEAQRAERTEISRLRTGVRVPRLAWALGAAAALALGIAFVVAPRHRPEPRAEQAAVQTPSARVELVYTAGEVTVDGKPASGGGGLLAEGSQIAVTRGAACLAMDPGIDVCLPEGSELVLSRVRSPWRKLDLLRGKVGVRLDPQPEGSHVSIVANGVWSTAVGTAFTVALGDEAGESGGRAVRTTVMNGKVRVGSDGGEEHVVPAHQRAEIAGGRAAVTALGRSDESPEWALLGPSELWRNPVSATLALRGLPQGVGVLLDSQAVGQAPLSTLVPAGPHVVQVQVDGQVRLTRTLVARVGQTTVLSFEASDLDAVTPVMATATVGTPQPVARKAATGAEPVPSATDMLAEARRMMRNAEFDTAAEQYRTLRGAYPHSAEAHTVLVSLAELELDRLGRPEQALLDLERYLIAGGDLAEEARYLRIRSLRALGQRDGEAEAIEEFLAAHPSSFRVGALERRLAELGQRR